MEDGPPVLYAPAHINAMKKIIYLLFIMMLCAAAVSCAPGTDGGAREPGGTDPAKAVLPGTSLEKTGDMSLSYAEQFRVEYYEGGYKLFTVLESEVYLLVPQGREVPEGLDASVKTLRAPVDNIYMASSSVMSLFDAMGALDRVLFSSLDASGWYVENAAEAIEEGRMFFAGKYSEPDYEALAEGECGLAVENTMILHSPKVIDMIEDIGVPVLIERSSYESHPLGRTEWIKFFGALLGKEEEAASYFESQKASVESMGSAGSGKSLGFFYISDSGKVVVYGGSSYVAKMVEIAGGEYVFGGIGGEEGGRSSVNITLEDFYSLAKDADYLVYNATIAEPVHTVEQLKAKSGILEDLKAVREGNVWCTGKYMYQAADIMGDIIRDINMILSGEETGQSFIYKLKSR